MFIYIYIYIFKVHKSSTFEYLSLCGAIYATAKYQGTLKSAAEITINLTKSPCKKGIKTLLKQKLRESNNWIKPTINPLFSQMFKSFQCSIINITSHYTVSYVQ